MIAGPARNEALIFPHLVPVPENRLALAAVRRLAASMESTYGTFPAHLVFIHGPSGTGKTHVISALADDVRRRIPTMSMAILSAGDFRAANDPALWEDCHDTDLLVLEDLQHFPPALAEPLAQLLDHRQSYDRTTVITSGVGPCRLALPPRLSSRLSAGLMVVMEAFSTASRLTIIRTMAQRRQFVIAPEIASWLADNLSGNGRQLVAALDRLAMLSRSHPGPLDLATVTAVFREQAVIAQPTVEHIVRHVGRHFHVDPRHLQSQRRHRQTLLPRQISMYLIRRLTDLSFSAIGTYFGGRDHSTVAHACRKVEHELARDFTLASTIKQIQAELT